MKGPDSLVQGAVNDLPSVRGLRRSTVGRGIVVLRHKDMPNGVLYKIEGSAVATRVPLFEEK